MRLINTHTMQMEEFEGKARPYAILSHRWRADEISYRDFDDLDRRVAKAGFLKIQQACELARGHGLGYLWVDTCCIDKSSSAELSEAINSMFKWYAKSDICYAYLDDVHVMGEVSPEVLANGVLPTDVASEFSRSSWFTRGWTLQELIAPKKVVFYCPLLSGQWLALGTKENRAPLLEEITHIDAPMLCGDDLSTTSIAKRMSWAAFRETTREEDVAYCLMGLFNVNMPLLYGEGCKAFVRLQEEIVKETDDHSIFAWKAIEGSVYTGKAYRGILATSPQEFAQSRDIMAYRDLTGLNHLSVTNLGIQITALLRPLNSLDVKYYTLPPGSKKGYLLRLNCYNRGNPSHSIAIVTVERGTRQLLRVFPHRLADMPPAAESDDDYSTIYVVKNFHSDRILRPPNANWPFSFHLDLSGLPSIIGFHSVYPPSLRYHAEERLLELDREMIFGASNVFRAAIVFRHKTQDMGFLVYVEVPRVSAEGTRLEDEESTEFICQMAAQRIAPVGIQSIQTSFYQCCARERRKTKAMDLPLSVPPRRSISVTISLEHLSIEVTLELGKLRGCKMFLLKLVQTVNLY